MRRSSTHWLPPSVPAVGALLAAAPLLACVTQGTHREVVDERDMLLQDKSRLEHENSAEKSHVSRPRPADVREAVGARKE